MADPHFTMFWSEDIPHVRSVDGEGRETVVSCIAGRLSTESAPAPPPPDSWASQPESDLAIWTLKLAPYARTTLPPAAGGDTRRKLYLFRGASVSVDGRRVADRAATELRADRPVELVNGDTESELLTPQGRPIGERVAQYGPFVMNTEQKLRQAFADYERTRFGGWPWPDAAPVHGSDPVRFAHHADGRVERRDKR